MTTTELIRALRKVHDEDFTPKVYSHSICGVAADRMEIMLAECDEMEFQIQKEICKRVDVERENKRLREDTKMMPKWVSVSERLPSDEKPVLAYYGFDNDGSGYLGMMFVGVLSYFCFDPDPHWQHADSNLVVTHWMPLPDGPKEVKMDG